jgi:hypothetical protein
MDDFSKPPEAADTALDDAKTLEGMWDRFRAGEVVPCPIEGSRFALTVDAAANVYRLVCTENGHTSPWFEAGPGGLHLRGLAPPSSVRGGAIDE